MAVWKLGLKEAVKDREVAVRRCREFAVSFVFASLVGERERADTLVGRRGREWFLWGWMERGVLFVFSFAFFRCWSSAKIDDKVQ